MQYIFRTYVCNLAEVCWPRHFDDSSTVRSQVNAIRPFHTLDILVAPVIF